MTPIGQPRHAPATRYALPNGQTLGIIASTTQPFCGDCDRARLTADGQLLTCLYATQRRRPARTAAKRHERRRSRDADSRAPGIVAWIGAPRRAWPSRIAPRSSLATRCGPSPTSKCTRAAADATAAHLNSSVPVFEVPEPGVSRRERTRPTQSGPHSAISVRHGYCMFCTCRTIYRPTNRLFVHFVSTSLHSLQNCVYTLRQPSSSSTKAVTLPCVARQRPGPFQATGRKERRCT